MLQAVSWAVFLKAVLAVAICYYSALGVLIYRKRLLVLFRGRGKTLFIGLALTGLAGILRAQDGNAGISQANGLIRGYFQTGTDLMYAIGAVLGLVGAVRVFREWNSGHQQEAYRAATAWFGSCIFLVIVATVIKSFFGI
jgi:hypothetical protein